MNIYVDLTHEFNATGLNAILSSGQAVVLHGLAAMETALDAERCAMIHANERRLERYLQAAAVWPKLSKQLEGLPLPDAHRVMVQHAAGTLPFEISSEG